VVVAQAERLSVLVTDLLDISRIQQGRLTLAQEPFDLAALVSRVVDEVRPTAEGRAIGFTGPDDEPLIISGDPIRLEQVLNNLISNALKYSRDGDRVAVLVERDGQLARVQVRDTGIGIPAEALPHLFERYYRASNAAAGQIAGMGVGLFVVREIVAMHGGEVEVSSVEGEGSVFTVTLPIAAS
jgi:signal transduction histidine kinase